MKNNETIKINMAEIDFMSILNTISSAIIAAKPIIENSFTKDFEVVFFNDEFYRQIDRQITKCRYFHEFKDIISPSVPWLDLADKVLNGIQLEPITYFSKLSNAWFRIQMSGTKEGLVVINFDNITKEKEQDQKLLETAYIDMLTGLNNRNKFMVDIESIISQAQFSGEKLGFLLVDIDNMKNINDYNGHSSGDNIIRKAAEILRKFSRNTIQAYRFGGDEFLIIIKNCDSTDTLGNVSDTIFESFCLEQISISGGAAAYPDDSESCEDLLRFTDIAMHYAKKEGKHRITHFKPDMQRIFIQKLNMQTKMASAINKSDFYLVYQPQFDTHSGDLRGFEALIRWKDKDIGNIEPSVFIPMAEESNLIIPIGNWVLKTAFSTLKKWQMQYNFKGIMSINISPIQLKQPDFIENIQNFLNSYELDAKSVEIEITEGIMIDNMDDTVQKLNSLKNLGFRISLDDFGTGYSSLSYIQLLPLSTLKIDKSFINGITEKDGIQANITNSIITMVTKMGLETIAEGVEKPEQLQLLKNFNCHIIQGFLRGKPMPETNCDEYLSGNKAALISIEED